MDARQLQVFFNFYCRFTFSFSAIGYHVRRLFWKDSGKDLQGKTVLVTGASGGIGSSVVTGTIASGASVFAVARDQAKLDAVRGTLPADDQDRMIDVLHELSLQSEIHKLVESCVSSGKKIDVLVNNVGLMLHDMQVTDEGLETSFAANLLNHYLLTTELMDKGVLADDAVVINVSSGGMYNAPLVLEGMNLTNEAYNGVVAYTLHKRAQVELAKYWRKENQGTDRKFYVMHPGWVDTPLVKASLPTFRKILHLVLRDEPMGADTINWLATEAPAQADDEKIWFDRKPRKTHLSAKTQQSKSNCDDLVEFLKSKLV